MFSCSQVYFSFSNCKACYLRTSFSLLTLCLLTSSAFNSLWTSLRVSLSSASSASNLSICIFKSLISASISPWLYFALMSTCFLSEMSSSKFCNFLSLLKRSFSTSSISYSIYSTALLFSSALLSRFSASCWVRYYSPWHSLMWVLSLPFSASSCSPCLSISLL